MLRHILALAIASSAFAEPIARPWTDEVIYFALTDRFLDGDPANNVPRDSDPALHDPQQRDIGKYHGGDFRGIEQAIKAGYFQKLGVTALWITPPVRNAWNSLHDLGDQAKTGYHGYWAQDFLDVDPHLASAQSLDGRTYADSADGRLEHYRDLVTLAHQNGLRVIQDVVVNHIGPCFYYDVNKNGQFDVSDRAEWIQPFKPEGFYDNNQWADVKKWNLARVGPTGPVQRLGAQVKTVGILSQRDSYGRKGFSNDSLGKSDGTEMVCDFFSLRDVWTKPSREEFFDRMVNEFVEIYAFYIETVGVDGLRLDTVKHVHHGFWDEFMQRLRARLGPERAARLFVFGEVFDGNPANVGRYTYRAAWPQERGPALDATLDFPFCFGAREFLRQKGKLFGDPRGIERAWRSLRDEGARPPYCPEPGPDGLTAAQKSVLFVENHDGINRFRAGGISERQNVLANALLLTSPGIPCLYYGTETALEDTTGQIGPDTETGRLTFAPDFSKASSSASFGETAALIALRKTEPALRTGAVQPVWADGAGDEDNGVFIYVRHLAAPDKTTPGEAFVIAINADDKPRSAGGANGVRLIAQGGAPLAASGAALTSALAIGSAGKATLEFRDGFPHLRPSLPPRSINIWRLK